MVLTALMFELPFAPVDNDVIQFKLDNQFQRGHKYEAMSLHLQLFCLNSIWNCFVGKVVTLVILGPFNKVNALTTPGRSDGNT